MADSKPDAPSKTAILAQIGDEIRLQAWLAGAEMRHPSLREGTNRNEVDLLASARDELRVQMHLGKLEARDEFDRLEHRWREWMKLASRVEDEVGEKLHDVMSDIRDGYKSLQAKILPSDD